MADAIVLIVEDDADLAFALGVRLRRSGYDVITAPDAVMAQQLAVRDQPDVIILDLGLPGGGGMTSLRRAKSNANTALMPVVVLTASDHSVEADVHDAGAVEFHQKPVDNATLTDVIERALGRQEASV